MAAVDALSHSERDHPDRELRARYNAYAQITAKCSADNHHAFALFMQVEDDRIEQVRYSRASAKIQFESSPQEVQTAVELFCSFAIGRRLDQVTCAGLLDVAAAHGAGNLDVASLHARASALDGHELDALRRELGDAVFCLLVGGAVPFVLFNWAALNLRIKRVINTVMGLGPHDQVRFRDVGDVYNLLAALNAEQILGRHGRSLELGVRSLHCNTLDESSMRSAYQRDTYTRFLADARQRGFLNHFEQSSTPHEGVTS